MQTAATPQSERPTQAFPENPVDAALGAAPPGAAPPPGTAPLVAAQPSGQKYLSAAVGVLALLLLANWWSANSEIRSLREELARRLQSGEIAVAEAKLIAKTAQDGAKELQGKVGILENKQSEVQSLQVAVEALNQDLSKNRDDWALAEIEQVISTASQQLQLAGNVPGALIALQNADRTLSRSDKPEFIAIRRAIARDIEKLKVLPILDLTGIALRLDSVISLIDELPMWSDEKPVQPAIQPKNQTNVKEPAGKVAKAGDSPGVASEWMMRINNLWQSWTSEMWNEMRQLIRVRSVKTPDALMMSPSQAYFARENVKLRLLNARLALLSRNESAFRSDMIAAQDNIAKYFDTRAKQTQSAQENLRLVQGSNLAIEMPILSDSLLAVRNKGKP